MAIECEKCGSFFKTAKLLAKHQKISKQCHQYQDIIFVCKRCNFHTKGINNIKTHLEECEGVNNINDPFDDLINQKNTAEDEKKILKIRSTQMESKIKKFEMDIMNLQLKLQFERMKNKIYTQIIQSQTNIKIDDLIQEFEDEVHIFNFRNGNIPLIIHDFVNEEKKTEKIILENIKPTKKSKKKDKKKKVKIPKKSNQDVQFVIEEESSNRDLINESSNREYLHYEEKQNKLDKTPKKKKKTYRKVNEYIKTTKEELEDKLQQDIERVDKELGEIVYNNFDVSHKEITDEIDELMTKVENSRIYTYNLNTIKKKRNKLLGKLSLEEYTTLIQNHINKLTDIFKSKNKSRKDITKNIQKSMSPLDMRLVFYEGYINSTIEIDDVQRFSMALDILKDCKKQFTIYNKFDLFKNIKNYGLSLFEICVCFERCVINRYGYNNIIYTPKTKSDLKDPYSFYSLETIDSGNRCWKMECRLEDFTNDFIDNILQYCINLFRNIYRDVFNDNIYRSDYMGKSQVTEFDCEQLLLNIISISKPIELCKSFQQIIIEKSTFTPTETDKFNFYADDRLQQKRFKKPKDDTENIQRVIKMLFDNINLDQIEEILSTR